ncbi:MAG: GGDEF domain-containing protein [Gammaproteobacteria bacterium]|nr:GGDEF domain-containing protein [Gammaproteobacteria bacterium]
MYKLVLALLLSTTFVSFISKVSAQKTIDQGEYESLVPFSVDLKTLTFEERINWLEVQLETQSSFVQRYRLYRELALQFANQNKDDKVSPICSMNPPQEFDLQYRLICLENSNNKNRINQLLTLHSDAISRNDVLVAAKALDLVAWLESVNGNIAQAFQTYEKVLPLAEQTNIYFLTNVTLNLALMYVLHGDEDYIQKGIKLKLAAIERLKQLKQDDPKATAYADRTITAIHFNIGIAYALHLNDYRKAIVWFSKVPEDNEDLIESKLVFSSLSYAELNDEENARELLTKSLNTKPSVEFNSDYLACYQQIIQIQLSISNDITNCEQLSEQTPLEVKQDLVKRMIESAHPGLQQIGYQKLYELYIDKLEPQLKQSTMKAASRAELSRLEQESRLKSELIEKEIALKEAEEAKVAIRTKLNITSVLIFTLILIVVLMQLRQKKKLALQFEEISLHDRLTGLHNRRYLEQNIDREMSFVKRAQHEDSRQTIAFYLFDIDHFKNINDSYGHDVGDAVLKEFSKRAQQVIRDTDLLARWGGEEFLLVSRLQSLSEYHGIAERIRDVMDNQRFKVTNNRELEITCTIGGVICPNLESMKQTVDWPQLVKLADKALYLGKHERRNCWVCIDHLPDNDTFNLALLDDLKSLEQQKLLKLSRHHS